MAQEKRKRSEDIPSVARIKRQKTSADESHTILHKFDSRFESIHIKWVGQ